MAYFEVEAFDGASGQFLTRKEGAVCLDAVKVIKAPVYYTDSDTLPDGVSVGDEKEPGVYESIEGQPGFTPYMDLAEEQVLNWVKSYLGAARIKEYEDAIVEEVEQAASAPAPAPQLPKAPWAPPVDDYVEIIPPPLD